MCITNNLSLKHSLASRTFSVAIGIFIVSLVGCGIGDEQGMMNEDGPTVSTTTTDTDATASLAWDPVNDSTVIGYYIHYGKTSPNQSGSCSYEYVQFVPSSRGMVTDLDLGSLYYFAVSAYNGIEGNCSNEVSTTT